MSCTTVVYEQKLITNECTNENSFECQTRLHDCLQLQLQPSFCLLPLSLLHLLLFSSLISLPLGLRLAFHLFLTLVPQVQTHKQKHPVP